MNETKHTPTPWRIAGPYVMALADKKVCTCPSGGKVDEANIRLITKAANHHDELVAALEGMMKAYRETVASEWGTTHKGLLTSILEDEFQAADAVLAKLKAE